MTTPSRPGAAWLAAALCLAALATSCSTSPELKAEKAAWQRCVANVTACEKVYRNCREKFPAGDYTREGLEAASAKCKPLDEAVDTARARFTGFGAGLREQTVLSAAMKARHSDPNCKEEDRLRGLRDDQYQSAQQCWKASPEHQELELLKAEFLQACQKCGLKERCEKNYQHNRQGAGLQIRQPKTAEEKERLEKDRAEWAKMVAAAGGRELLFACDR